MYSWLESDSAINILVNKTLFSALFKKGDRVFHPQFGIGAVNDVQANGQTYTYVVEFSKHGEKSLDSEYCDLKRF